MTDPGRPREVDRDGVEAARVTRVLCMHTMPGPGSAAPPFKLGTAQGGEARGVIGRAFAVTANLGKNQGATWIQRNDVELVVADARIRRDNAVTVRPKKIAGHNFADAAHGRRQTAE